MNKILLLAFCITLANLAEAAPRNYRQNTATNNLTISYGARIFSELVFPKSILIDNNSNQEIEVNCMTSGTATAPPISELDSFWVRSATSLGLDGADIKGDCWLRAVGGTANSGVIIITINAEN